MNSVLILGADYYDSTNANGVCVRRLAEQYSKDGVNVIVVSTSQTSRNEELINGVQVKYFPYDRTYLRLQKMQSKRNSLFGLCEYFLYRFFRNLRLLASYPNNYPLRSKGLVSYVTDIIRKHNISLMICTCKPYDSIYCGVEIKKIFKDTVTVKTYYLDNIFEPETTNPIAKYVQKKRSVSFFLSEESIVDAIFLPINCKDNPLFLSSKINFVGFPLYYVPSDYAKSDFVYPDDTINFIYIGTLNNNNRNPEYIINTVDYINTISRKKHLFHIWGKIQDEECRSLIEKSDSVCYHGPIDNCYTVDLIKRCDCVVNISNKSTIDFIPSKIFQLFALNVKIVNIFYDQRDCSLSYFGDYKNSISLNYKTTINDSALSVIKFIETPVNTSNTSDNLFRLFTPSYICNLLSEVVK